MPKLSQEFPQIQTLRRPGAAFAVSLVKRRTWFAEGDENEEGDPPEQDDAGENNGDSAVAQRLAALEKRLDEQKAENVQLRKERDDARKANKRRQEEEGNWKTLYEEAQAEIEALKPYKAEAETALGSIQESNERKIKQIPDSKRHIVPELPPMKLQDWLDRSLADLTREAAPDFDAGAGGNNGGGREAVPKLTPDEQVVLQKTGMSAEDFAKAKKALGTPESN